MTKKGRYIATVLLWPSKYKDSIIDVGEQRRRHASWLPLTPLVRRFDHLPRAKHWCRVVVTHKKRATRWWLIEEQVGDEQVEVINATYDLVPYTAAEEKLMARQRATEIPVSLQISMKRDIAEQMRAAAKSIGLSVEEFAVKSVVELIKRILDEAIGGSKHE